MSSPFRKFILNVHGCLKELHFGLFASAFQNAHAATLLSPVFTPHTAA
jgi:hypothetical protein